MCNLLGTIFIGDVLKHFGATIVIKVDINIGQ